MILDFASLYRVSTAVTVSVSAVLFSIKKYGSCPISKTRIHLPVSQSAFPCSFHSLISGVGVSSGGCVATHRCPCVSDCGSGVCCDNRLSCLVCWQCCWWWCRGGGGLWVGLWWGLFLITLKLLKIAWVVKMKEIENINWSSEWQSCPRLLSLLHSYYDDGSFLSLHSNKAQGHQEGKVRGLGGLHQHGLIMSFLHIDSPHTRRWLISFFKKMVRGAQKEETRRTVFVLFCLITLMQGWYKGCYTDGLFCFFRTPSSVHIY